MKIFLPLVVLLYILIVCYFASGSNQWPDHDVSTLRQLQIVHRHGDRTPTDFFPDDPYRNESYWPEGIGQLTTRGKYRMYRLGQFIRAEYDAYLGPHYSPREVYARSSITARCIESVSCLLSGAYPPKAAEWQWDTGAELGHLWQPFPIETFMPKVDDLVCNEDKYCPASDREQEKIYARPEVRKFVADRAELFRNLSKVVGRTVNSIEAGRSLHGTLEIEISRGYYWSDVWSREEEEGIVTALRDVHDMSYVIDWDSPLVKRLRGGGLVGELVRNVRSGLSGGFAAAKKLYAYSTHDTVLAALMHALNIFNGRLPPFGSTLFVELHANASRTSGESESRSTDDYFVRFFYHNETLTGVPNAVRVSECGGVYDCPLTRFLEFTKAVIYTDFDKECNEIRS